MFHHTATPVGVADSAPLDTVTFGREGLPGPICNVMVGRDGRAYVVASGKANHAGFGGPWRTVPQASPGTGNIGNERIFGLEVVNNGTGEPWSEKVLDSVTRVFAAVLKRLGKDASWCLGHKEWAPTRKIDPSLDMNAYRARLAAYMEGDMADERFTDFIAGWESHRRGDPIPVQVGFKRKGWNFRKEAVSHPEPAEHDHPDMLDHKHRTGIGEPSA